MLKNDSCCTMFRNTNCTMFRNTNCCTMLKNANCCTMFRNNNCCTMFINTNCCTMFINTNCCTMLKNTNCLQCSGILIVVQCLGISWIIREYLPWDMDQVLGSRGHVLTYTGGPQHHRYQGRTQVRPFCLKYSASSDGIRPLYLNQLYSVNSD